MEIERQQCFKDKNNDYISVILLLVVASVTRNKFDSNFYHVDEGFEVVEKVKTLFNVVFCGIMIGTLLLNFVLKRIRHVHALVEMGKDSILN